jgi:NAD(P)-dependent dehydrogenase (short-subunit alcohol dehydrogenase family)
MTDELADRVVLIAGAHGALGSAILDQFAQARAQLALASNPIDVLRERVAAKNLAKERVMLLEAKAAVPDRVEALVAEVVGRLGRVDVLLNAVGGWNGGAWVEETSVHDWDQMLNLNLRPAFLLSRAVLPHMLEAGWGRIVHVSSRAALEPRPKQVGFAVSMMGVITLTEGIAAEVEGTGVTANVILTGSVEGQPNPGHVPEAGTQKGVPPEHKAAAMMRFLCSDAGALINGARIPI